MTFTLIDVILIVFVVIFMVTGAVLGFIHTLGSFLGAIVGVFVASHLAAPIADALAPAFGGNTQIVSIVVFSVIYLLASRLFGFFFYVFEKSVGLAAKLPFLKSFDKLLGMIFGFLEGVIAVAAFVYFAGSVLPVDWINNLVETSQVGAWMLSIFGVISALVPQAVRDAVMKAIDSAV